MEGNNGRETAAKYLNDRELSKKALTALRGLTEKGQPIYAGRYVVPLNWLRSLEAVYAYKTSDFEGATAIVEELGDDFLPGSIGHTSQRGLGMFKASAKAYSGKHKVEAVGMMNLLSKKFEPEVRLQRLKERIKDIERISDTSEIAEEKAYFSGLREIYRNEIEYIEGKKTKLNFAEGFVNWHALGRLHAIKRESSTSATITANIQKQSLRSFNFFRGPKTIEVDITFNDPNVKATAGVQVGEWIFLEDEPFASGPVCVTIDHFRGQAGLEFPNRGGVMPRFKIPKTDGTYRVKVNCQKSYVECFVNDRFVFRSNSAVHQHPINRVGVSTFGYMVFNGSIKFSNMSVRKWVGVPDKPNKKVIGSFYREQAEKNPDDPFANYFLGLAYYNIKDYERAKKWLLRSHEKGLHPSQTALILGDVLDRLDEPQEARAHYKHAFDSVQNDNWVGFQVTDIQFNFVGQKVPALNDTHRACARYLWSALFSKDVDLEIRKQLAQNVPSEFKMGEPWMDDILQAKIAFLKGDSRRAASLVRGHRVRANIPKKHQADHSEFLRLVMQNQEYFRDPNLRAAYTDSQKLRAFTFMQDHLSEPLDRQYR